MSVPGADSEEVFFPPESCSESADHITVFNGLARPQPSTEELGPPQRDLRGKRDNLRLVTILLPSSLGELLDLPRLVAFVCSFQCTSLAGPCRLIEPCEPALRRVAGGYAEQTLAPALAKIRCRFSGLKNSSCEIHPSSIWMKRFVSS